MNNFPSVQIFDLFYFGVTSFFETKNFGSKICPKNAPILEIFSEFFMQPLHISEMLE